MKGGGYFRVYRDAYEKIFSKGPAVWAAFSWLLFQAEWREGSDAGRVSATVAEIAKDCQLSRAQARRALEWLAANETIAVESRIGRGLGVTITLNNWSYYQRPQLDKSVKGADLDKPRPKLKWVGDEE